MVTKSEAKAAWQTIMNFSVMHSNQTSVRATDITRSMQDAVVTLNKYFEEAEINDKTNDE